MPTVSLIVPCFKSAEFLDATIRSILRQDLRDWELVLVDDGSPDATWEVIESCARQDSRILGYRKPNEGTTRARNYGVMQISATARYLFFLDHDDQLEPWALSRLVNYLEANPEVGLVACQRQDIDQAGNRLDTGHIDRWAPGRIFPHRMRDAEIETPFATFFCATGQGPNAMYRRSVYSRTEGWETAFWPHEDTDMFCQMALLAKVHYLTERLYLKRIHPAQGMNSGRVQDAYKGFRAKWDNRVPRNAEEGVVLAQAKKYYYSLHRPCRNLKVSLKALRAFLRQPSWAAWRWFVHLFGTGLYRLLCGGGR